MALFWVKLLQDGRAQSEAHKPKAWSKRAEKHPIRFQVSVSLRVSWKAIGQYPSRNRISLAETNRLQGYSHVG